MGTSGKGASFEQYFFGHTARVTKIAVNPKNDTMLSAAQVCVSAGVSGSVDSVRRGDICPYVMCTCGKCRGVGWWAHRGRAGGHANLLLKSLGEIWTGATIPRGQQYTHHPIIVASITLTCCPPPSVSCPRAPPSQNQPPHHHPTLHLQDKEIRLWDLRVPQCQAVLQAHCQPTVAFDQQGLVFAVGLDNGSIKLYDAGNYEQGPFENFVVSGVGRGGGLWGGGRGDVGKEMGRGEGGGAGVGRWADVEKGRGREGGGREIVAVEKGRGGREAVAVLRACL